MSEAPVPQDPGRTMTCLARSGRSGWMSRATWRPSVRMIPVPAEPEEYQDPDNAPPPGMDDAQLAALIAEAREVTAEQAEAEAEMARAGQAGIRAVLGSVAAGRRGPGMPGSAHRFPGEYTSRAAGFASGKPLDVAPGGPVLAPVRRRRGRGR